MIKNNVLAELSEKFATRIIKMCKYLHQNSVRCNAIDQIYRSGTSIGANIAESTFAQSRADFISKLKIALKEANETKYWLLELYNGEYITEIQYNSMLNDVKIIIGTLVNVVNKLQKNTPELKNDK